MLLSTLLLPFAAFATLVAGDACQLGGAEADVDTAHRCCNRLSAPDKWFSGNPNQGICVMNSTMVAAYNYCLHKWAPKAKDARCIECDETTNCGLKDTD
jgi:hypothetical protein